MEAIPTYSQDKGQQGLSLAVGCLFLYVRVYVYSGREMEHIALFPSTPLLPCGTSLENSAASSSQDAVSLL